MSDLVGNSEDRFSRVADHIMYHLLFKCLNYLSTFGFTGAIYGFSGANMVQKVA